MERRHDSRTGRALRVAVVAGATATLLVSSAAVAKPSDSTASTTLTPRFASVRDWSQCDDGGGTSICSATSSATVAGDGKAEASLRPKVVVGTGRAEGRGGAVATHNLKRPVAGIKYRFVFDGVSATASTSPAVAHDLLARALVAGYAWHSRCSTCTAVGYQPVADADPLTALPDTAAPGQHVVEVEVRNPGGKVPAGTLSANGFFVADVGTYDAVGETTSAGSAVISGRLSRIEVQTLAV